MSIINATAHAENYERESKQKTLTAHELHALLTAVIADGHGARPVFMMRCEGLTHADPITLCFASEPYDGEIVWLAGPAMRDR